MKKVPCMISSKDLSYISDMFNWNMTAYQKIMYYLQKCKDEDVCKEFKKACKIHLDNCNILLSLLKEGN